MTIKETLNTIHLMGVRAKWDPEYQEFIIAPRIKGHLNTPITEIPESYFTSDADDAIATARLMREDQQRNCCAECGRRLNEQTSMCSEYH